MSSQYETDMGDQSIDVSARNRKFQASIIITQDKDKSGILSFLSPAGGDSSSTPTDSGANY